MTIAGARVRSFNGAQRYGALLPVLQACWAKVQAVDRGHDGALAAFKRNGMDAHFLKRHLSVKVVVALLPLK